MARLTLHIGSKIGALRRGVSRAWGAVKGFAGRVRSAMGGLAGSLGLAFGGAALISFTKNLITAGDEIGKVSKRIGVSAEDFQKLSFAARRSGADTQDIEKAFKRLSSVVLDAESGLTENVRALAELGLTWQRLKGMKPEEQFRLIAERLNNVEDASRKTALAQDFFGKAGTKLIPMIGDYERLRQEVEDLGGVLSDDAVKAAEEFQDAMENLGTVIKASIANSGMISWLANIGQSISDIQKSKKELEKIGAADRGIGLGIEHLPGMKVGAIGIIKQVNLADRLLKKVGVGALDSLNRRMQRNFARAFEGIVITPPTMAEDVSAANELRKKKVADEEAQRIKAEQIIKEEALRKAKEKGAALEEKQFLTITEQVIAYEEKLRLQEMLNAGKEREVAIEKAIADTAKKAGRELEEHERAAIAARAGNLFDAQNKQQAELVGLKEGARKSAVETAFNVSDSVRRIGGTLGGANTQQNLIKDTKNLVTKCVEKLQSIDEKTTFEVNLDATQRYR